MEWDFDALDAAFKANEAIENAARSAPPPPPLPLPIATAAQDPLPLQTHVKIDTNLKAEPQPTAPKDAKEATSPLKRKLVRSAQQEEEEGIIQFRTVAPDCTDESMILLTGLKNIYQKQLPNMPKEYIARLVYDRNHLSMALVKPPLKVLAGITYRLFGPGRKMAEIVFCAVSSTEQVRGYGARLMSHVKDYVVSQLGIEYFLTYADNFAIGYFKKQGFTTEITLDKKEWMGYIKDYEGGTLMQAFIRISLSMSIFIFAADKLCEFQWTVVPKVVYLKAPEIIEAQRKAIRDKIRATASEAKVYSGKALFPPGVTSVPIQTIPGLAEIGWTPEMLKRLGENKPTKIHGPLYGPLKIVVEEMRTNANAWPFVEPVSGVPDYYEIIKEPMDISTLGSCVENDDYATIDHFVKDASKIFHNCRIYNEEGTNYVKCANKLEKWFKERIKTLRAELHIYI
ncbi:histone acetyltransferase [Chytriomyces hyalinus]|nr:histone acetyltransferase [Chytriomyces hyalinus]KAJ3265489.1 histone acetyltransferase [Chytriomyces hyalinus]